MTERAYTYLDLYSAADAEGWNTPKGRLLVAVAGMMDDAVCGEFIDTKGPCGQPPDHEGECLEPARPCCRRSASRCSC